MPSDGEPHVPTRRAAQPVVRRLTLAYAASLLVAALVALASVVGLTSGAGDVYGGSSSVLVSRGADAGSTLAEVGGRGHWVANGTVGTPVLVLGGALLWRRAPLGYVVAPGLLLVSAIGGVVFGIAAAVDNLLNGPWTEPAIIVVHLVISAVSSVLLAVFLERGRRSARSVAACLRSGLDSTGRPA